MKKFKLSVASLAICSSLGLAPVSLAFAADETEAKTVERIQVTGSRIKRTDMESASPISVFTSADIEAAGFTTIEDFVQAVPAMNGGAEGNSVNNGSRGFATAALRGLGSGRTLTLINGRRFASGDLNSIPVSYIERVEVLRDGASTVYGSDAIAGVINFITKKDFEGVEISAQRDITSEGDGEVTKFSLTTGVSSDKGNVVFSLEYSERESIYQGDRAFSECPIFEGDNGKYCGGSGTIPEGHFYGIKKDANGNPTGTAYAADAGYILDNGVPRLFNGETDAFNYSTTSKMQTPQEVFSINASSNYEITDNTSVFMEGGFTNRKSNQLMAPDGTFWGPVVPAANPGNPTGEDVIVYRRLRETDGRYFSQDFSDYRMVAGFEGILANDWSWDVSYNYSRYVDARIDEGRVNNERIETMLDPALCDADSECPAVWNILEAGTLTQDMIDYGFVTNSPVVSATTRQFIANLSGEVESFELPGGYIGWATGYEKRWEDYKNTPDGAASIGQIYGVGANPTSGEYTVDEVYVELALPILDDLNVSAAIRGTDYDFLSDTAINSKLGIEYTVLDGLLLRTNYAEGFRAPGITELFAPQSETNLAYSDPCLKYGTADVSATVKANCAADGLSGDFTLSSNQSSTIVGGQPELEPEESESFTAGFVYTAENGFSAAVDFYNIKITNGIGTAGTDNVVNGCYNSVDFSSSLCELIVGNNHPLLADSAASGPRRDALGAIQGVLLTNANLSTFETSGIDFDMSMSLDVMEGSLALSVDGTYLSSYEYTPFEGEDPVETAGFFAADQWETTLAVFPELRMNLNATYSTKDYSLSWSGRYQSEGEDLFAKETNLDNIADSVFYHDIQGSYFLDNYTFTVGARNVTDVEAPYTTNNQDMNTIPVSYDIAGAYYYAKVSVKF